MAILALRRHFSRPCGPTSLSRRPKPFRLLPSTRDLHGSFISSACSTIGDLIPIAVIAATVTSCRCRRCRTGTSIILVQVLHSQSSPADWAPVTIPGMASHRGAAHLFLGRQQLPWC